MNTVSQKAFARAGLLGNPSDGYNGKTIALIIRNFSATVTLSASNRLTIDPGKCENYTCDTIQQLAEQIDSQGYYGGVRLLKAAIKRFCDYCRLTGQTLHGKNFSIAYSSDIPRQVGLSGSSAIVIAALRGLMEWYDIEIQPHLLASLAVSAEFELGIPAGPQDRVIQAYEGVVYMDFDQSRLQTQHGLEFGVYEQLDPRSIPDLYVAYAQNASEPTEVLHNNLKQRFQQGEKEVLDAMTQFASFAEEGIEAIHRGDTFRLRSLINKNFDLRNQICQLHPVHNQMIEAARSVGASAKFCGSGGAIVGTLDDEDMFVQLQSELAKINCRVLIPQILSG